MVLITTHIDQCLLKQPMSFPSFILAIVFSICILNLYPITGGDGTHIEGHTYSSPQLTLTLPFTFTSLSSMTFKTVFTTVCLLLGGVALITEISGGKPVSTMSSSWDIKPTRERCVAEGICLTTDVGTSGQFWSN